MSSVEATNRETFALYEKLPLYWHGEFTEESKALKTEQAKHLFTGVDSRKDYFEVFIEFVFCKECRPLLPTLSFPASAFWTLVSMLCRGWNCEPSVFASTKSMSMITRKCEGKDVLTWSVNINTFVTMVRYVCPGHGEKINERIYERITSYELARKTLVKKPPPGPDGAKEAKDSKEGSGGEGSDVNEVDMSQEFSELAPTTYEIIRQRVEEEINDKVVLTLLDLHYALRGEDGRLSREYLASDKKGLPLRNNDGKKQADPHESVGLLKDTLNSQTMFVESLFIEMGALVPVKEGDEDEDFSPKSRPSFFCQPRGCNSRTINDAGRIMSRGHVPSDQRGILNSLAAGDTQLGNLVYSNTCYENPFRLSQLEEVVGAPGESNKKKAPAFTGNYSQNKKYLDSVFCDKNIGYKIQKTIYPCSVQFEAVQALWTCLTGHAFCHTFQFDSQANKATPEVKAFLALVAVRQKLRRIFNYIGDDPFAFLAGVLYYLQQRLIYALPKALRSSRKCFPRNSPFSTSCMLTAIRVTARNLLWRVSDMVIDGGARTASSIYLLHNLLPESEQQNFLLLQELPEGLNKMENAKFLLSSSNKVDLYWLHQKRDPSKVSKISEREMKHLYDLSLYIQKDVGKAKRHGPMDIITAAFDHFSSPDNFEEAWEILKYPTLSNTIHPDEVTIGKKYKIDYQTNRFASSQAMIAEAVSEAIHPYRENHPKLMDVLDERKENLFKKKRKSYNAVLEVSKLGDLGRQMENYGQLGMFVLPFVSLLILEKKDIALLDEIKQKYVVDVSQYYKTKVQYEKTHAMTFLFYRNTVDNTYDLIATQLMEGPSAASNSKKNKKKEEEEEEDPTKTLSKETDTSVLERMTEMQVRFSEETNLTWAQVGLVTGVNPILNGLQKTNLTWTHVGLVKPQP